jgi:Fic family protein
MMRNWEEVIESREPDITIINEKGKKVTKRGQSTWKEELKKITERDELFELIGFLAEELKKNTNKFFIKSNKTAGRRARNYAQKIKDIMGQIRVIIQNKPK